MKNARLFFTKTDECKYISHLDLNRVMLRAIQKSRLDIWRTEGFNRHAYITFALPLSLGFSSKKETMDFRLLDDNADMSAIPGMLNPCLPKGIRAFDCREQRFKPADIESALYQIRLTSDDFSAEEIYYHADALLHANAINVEKKTKKGMKTVDLKEYILSCSLKTDEDAAVMSLTLPAGSTTNINPNLFVGALAERFGAELYADITREEIYVKGGEPFA